MEAVFLRQRSNLFPPEPHQKGFYHPSKQKNLSKNEKQTCMSPARPRPPAALDPAAPHMSTQWDMVHAPVKNVSGDSSSSQFSESWPSSSELVGPSQVGESGRGQGDTLATYIHRFRHAPATCRAVREKPRETFWWKQRPTAHEQHVTPPRQPRDHSTPTSSGKKSVSVTPRVSSDRNDSLDDRTQSLIDKSSSLLTTSTSSSLPAQKYLNTRDQRAPQPDDNDPHSAKPHPPSLMHPLRELPLNPEEDILYQWRLQRRLEEARKEAAMAGEEGGVFEQRRKNGRWRGEMGLPHTHMHSSHSVTAAQNQSRYSVDEIDATAQARLTQPPHGISQQPNVCTCTQSLHQIGPPASHHPHLHSSHTHIPPHKHTLCDIVHCPYCSTAGESRLVEGMPGNGGPECLDLSGVELQGQSPGVKVTQVEPPRVQEDSPRLELVQSPEAKVTQVEPPGVQGDTSVDVNETPPGGWCRTEATAGKVPAKRIVQCVKKEGTRGKRDTEVVRVSESTTQHGREELPLAGRGGGRQGRPPVQYPSSPALVRHTSREPSHLQTSPSDSESSDEGSQLSLTFSSEFERTLTPRSAAPQTWTETSTPNIRPVLSQAIKEHLFGSPPSSPPPTAITTHTPSSPPPTTVTTHTSSPPPTVTTHIPSSSPPTTVTTHTPSSPPPTAITTHTHLSPLTTHGSPQRGTPTSKELLSAGVSDSVSWDIPWDDNNMGDELLKVLIDKAKLFEAQIWEIDRLLSIMSGD